MLFWIFRFFPPLYTFSIRATWRSITTGRSNSDAHKRADSRPTAAAFAYGASADEGRSSDKAAEKSYAARLKDIDMIMGNDGTEGSDSGKFNFIFKQHCLVRVRAKANKDVD